MSVHEDKPIETIRLSEDQKHRLVKQVNDHYHKPVPKERRDLRVPYHATGAVMVILHPNGTLTRHAVLPRNLSRGGISFMIGRFIYPDCEAQVILPERSSGRETITIPGRTLRCNHFSGMIHECAIVFKDPIDLGRFIDMTPYTGGSRQSAGATDGKTSAAAPEATREAPLVLVVDDQKNDRRLYRLWVEKLGFRAFEADTPDAAILAAKKHDVEIALINAAVASDQGLTLVKRLREAGYTGPAIVASSDNDPAARTHARGAGAEEFLLKPFDQIDLRHAIERLMSPKLEEADGNAIRSELLANESMKPLLREFVAGLNDTVNQLTRAGAAQDVDAIAALCRKLKGAGSGYGFPQVTQLALFVLDQLDVEQQDVEALGESVEELVALLKRVRAE